MTRGLRRVAAMPSGELRFRIISELRKTAARLSSAVKRPQWDRTRLLPVLDRSAASSAWTAALAALSTRDYLRAHQALGEHFTRRMSAFPLNARQLPDIAGTIAHDFPESPAQAARRAHAICDGRYDLLGFNDLVFGQNPDWHHDPVHNRRPPLRFWASVPFLDPGTGDHKLIWELNRHQHWLALGRAYALSGEPRFYAAFTSQLASWLNANPPLIGTNWASMLELAFRALSWLWALELFAGAAGEDDADPWIVDLLLGLDRHLTQIEHNMSHYFSPNTHLSGEALALYVAGLALPELKGSARRTAAGRNVLLQEATRQIRSDGGHIELSLHYHRYSTDFYLLAMLVARRAADPAARVFEEAARSQSRYLRAMTDDHGIRPQLGDDDGGQLFPICGRDAADCRDTLATASLLLTDPALALDTPPEETYWMCGTDAAAHNFDVATRCTSAALPSSGYYVSRTARGDQLIFDAGPHGFLNGGHAHSDALACVLSIAGRPVLIDPGTATYTMDPEMRNRFRGTTMHNTVVLDGRPQSTPWGAFHWHTTATGRAPIWRTSSDCDYVEGTHDAYAPRRHTRAILAIHGVGWWILDHLLGADTCAAECYWHLHPSWECEIERGHIVRLRTKTTGQVLASTASLTLLPGDQPLAAWSRAYGLVEPAPVVVGRTTGSLPTTIASFIPAAAELADGIAIEETAVEMRPGNRWHGCAFCVRWHGGAMAVLAAIEGDGVAEHDSSAPPDRWGTAELQTDARVAVFIDHAAGHSEAILVNGATVHAHRTHPLVSLPRRIPLMRVRVNALAPTVHEVGAGHGRE